MSETPLDRFRAAVQAVVRSLVPELDYSGHYEYVVVSCDGKTVSGRPSNTKLGLPEISEAPMRQGILGGFSMLTPGATCLVVFVDQDPTKPNVVAGDTSTLPLTTTPDATITVNLGNALVPRPVAASTDSAAGFVVAANPGQTKVVVGP